LMKASVKLWDVGHGMLNVHLPPVAILWYCIALCTPIPDFIL
jgi:hypothetical protein